MRKPGFCLSKNKGADQLCSNCEADHAFVLTTQIVQFLYKVNPEFPASSHLLCLYSSVCVRPGRKPQRPVFSHRSLFNMQSSIHYTFSRKSETALKLATLWWYIVMVVKCCLQESNDCYSKENL